LPDAFRVEVDATKFRRTLASTPDAFRAAMTQATSAAGLLFQRQFKMNQLRGRPGVLRRTGNLSQKMFSTTTEIDGGRVLVSGFGGVPYANIHEHGGTVRPTKSKWLTIPVGPALTASGVAKGPARSFPDLVLLIPKGLNRSPMLGKWKATGETLTSDAVAQRLATRNVYQGVAFNFRTGKARASIFVPYFILKKSVKIPARLGFFPSFKTFFGETGQAHQIILERVNRVVSRINQSGAQGAGGAQ